MKRKDFSNLKIEIQNKKIPFFEHENFIAGLPPFLRGIDSFPKNKPNSTQKTSFSTIKLDINNPNLDLKISELIEVDTILLSNRKNQLSEIEIAELLNYCHKLFFEAEQNNIKIDTIASKISFCWETSKNLAFEISKIRATRMLWAKMVNNFKNNNSLALEIHIENLDYISSIITKTTGAHLLSKEIISENSYLKETYLTKTIDPWGGSSLIEKLTEDFSIKTWQLFLKLINSQ